MKVIPHQNPSVNAPTMALTNLPKPIQKEGTIILGRENHFPAITTRHHVIDGTRINKTKRTGHNLEGE
jgi:hypothetical protein